MSQQQWWTLIASDTASVEKVKGSRENEAQSPDKLQSKHKPTMAAENLQAENRSRSSDSGEYEKNQGGRLFLSALLTPLSSSLPPSPVLYQHFSYQAWSDARVLLMMRISNSKSLIAGQKVLNVGVLIQPERISWK